MAESQQGLCHGLGSIVRPSVSIFLVYAMEFTILVGFSWNLHSLSISSIALTLLILKKIGKVVR